jgi:hypothetical protein
VRWFRRAPRPDAPSGADARPGEDAGAGEGARPDEDALLDVLLDLAALELDEPGVDAFACTTCGRTDLPPEGGWDPPICSECDAAINFDAILASGHFDRP